MKVCEMEEAKNNHLEISLSSGLVKPALTSGADDNQKCAGNSKNAFDVFQNGNAQLGIAARRLDSLDSESLFSEDGGETDYQTETNSPTPHEYHHKQDLFEAIAEGDLEKVEDLLDQPGANLDLTWYGQNMLVAALRAQQPHMAEFLIDVGVDCNFKSRIFDHKGEHVDCYRVSCRQMAYDGGMTDIVDLIDYKNGQKFTLDRLKSRKPYALRVETQQRLDETKESALLHEMSDRNNDATKGISVGEVRPKESFQHNHDPTLDYVTKYMRTQQSLRSTNHDEGYISTSPKSSTRGSPVSPNNGFHCLAKHVECFEDGVKPHKYSACSAHGSYSQESRFWAADRANGAVKVEDVDPDKTVHAQVRTQSPWRDDRQIHPRRQRRLPATPTSSTIHRPRIMSPPSQGTPRSSRMLLQANIVTLPNKLSFSTLPNTMSPRDLVKRAPTVAAKSRQIPYGKNNTPSLSDSLVCNKYDEHFVTNNDPPNKRSILKTATYSTKV